MKVSSSFSLMAFAITIVAAQITNQSAPFSLVLTSKNATINGSVIVPSHEGAGIEGLIITSGPPSISNAVYQFNTSSTTTGEATPPNDGPSGLLTYLWDAGNLNLSVAMDLSESVISNVAMALFTPSESSLYVAFDNKEKLNIQGYPANIINPPYNDTKAYYRWYACNTDFLDYTYPTLNWVIGSGAPDNPTCVKVDVVRVFA